MQMVTTAPKPESLVLATLRRSMLLDLDIVNAVHRRPPSDFTRSDTNVLVEVVNKEVNAAMSLMGRQFKTEMRQFAENRQMMVSEELFDDLSAVLILKIKAEYLLKFIADNKLADVAFARMMSEITPVQAPGVKVPVHTPEQPAA